MEILYPRCAGLDVHKETVAASVLTPGPNAEPNQQIRQFGTTTGELRRLGDWLRENGVTHAAMESTGVYWKPVFNILESACELSRMRTTLVREGVQVGNRLRKVLEDANIKLDSVASDALGVSGRAMIRVLIEGRDEPGELAELAHGRLRAKRPELAAALEGRVTGHHRFLLRELMRQLEFLEQQVAVFEQQFQCAMPPFEWAAGLLMTMPRGGPHGRLCAPRRDRRGHEPLRQFPALVLLGRTLPGQQRECGQAAFGQESPRQPVDQSGHD